MQEERGFLEVEEGMTVSYLRRRKQPRHSRYIATPSELTG